MLVWFKKYRPWMLLAGIGFHIGIDIMMVIPIFSYAMIAAYPAFLNDGETRWLVDRLLLRKRRPSEVPSTPAVANGVDKPNEKRKKKPRAARERSARPVPRPGS